MNFEQLKTHEIVIRFGELVKTERKVTQQVLECIAEIDRRKIYLERAYPSLFDFLVKEFGYSPSAAFRRIESARLLREIPEIAEKVQAGALNLSQLSQMQQAIRATQKLEKRKIPIEEKREVLKSIENVTYKNTEIILAKHWSLPAAQEKEKSNSDESTSMTITLSKEQMAKISAVRDLVSHSVGRGLAEVFVYLAENELKRRKNKVSKSDDGQHCHYRDPITQQVCGSTRYLQVDHVYPRWAGGGDAPENLQVLCGAHNRYKFAQEVGLLPNRK